MTNDECPPVMSFRTFDPVELSQSERHGYLLAAVAPRPIAFASTVDAAGRVNLSPFSFFNVFSSNPPVMVFSPSRRGRDNSAKDTYYNLLEVPEAAISIVNYAMVEQMSLASTEYERGVNEFVKAGFSAIPSQRIKPPWVGESPVSFECEVDEIIPLGEEGGAGTLVIARVVLMHIQERLLDPQGKLDPTRLDQVGRMGGNWYCRAGSDALFEMPRPPSRHSIGIDGLPESVRKSRVLTGNNLGRLGTLERLPEDDTVKQVAESEEVQEILIREGLNDEARRDALHRLAQSYLEQGDVEKALCVLLTDFREKT